MEASALVSFLDWGLLFVACSEEIGYQQKSGKSIRSDQLYLWDNGWWDWKSCTNFSEINRRNMDSPYISLTNDPTQWPNVDRWWGRRKHVALILLCVYLGEFQNAATSLVLYPNYRSNAIMDIQLTVHLSTLEGSWSYKRKKYLK